MTGVFTFLMSVLWGGMAKFSWASGRESDALLFLLMAVVFLALSVYFMWTDRPERWRHRKRGSTYTIVDAQGIVQTETLLGDYDMVVIYRDEKTGRHYVRPPTEFSDGRFEKL